MRLPAALVSAVVAFAALAAPQPSATPLPEKGARTTISKAGWGVTLAIPGGWKSAEKDGTIVAGSDTEAGLIVIRYLPRVTREELLRGYQAGINEGGFTARPISAATSLPAGGGTALAGVLEGMGGDGNVVRVRSVGVLSQFGGGLVVTGFTTRPMYATLAARTDAIATTATFRAPPRNAGLAGNYEYVYVSKSGSYSRESKITLCQSGRFTKSGEMAGSGSAGSAVTSRQNGGTWQATGDGAAGILTLTWNNGAVSTFNYRVSQDPRDRSSYGAGVQIGDTLYQKTGPGGC
jgi:uncharacterized membrane protein YphA (DoxX/SURF4 family)